MTETYNNGKDLTPGDIFVRERKTEGGEVIYVAFLAFAPVAVDIDGNKVKEARVTKPKFYYASARTKQAAIDNLTYEMIEHLKRLQSKEFVHPLQNL